MDNLVIMESPSKASTVKGYLGSSYKVVASQGHVRDLPKSSLGIDVDHGFEAHYINIRGKGDLIKELKKEAKSADRIFLATDPDREGEAISWHLMETLGLDPKKTKRISFNEVTKTAVKEAIRHPREIDMNLVNSQQARRILDRIVGYQISPLLWKTVKSGLSAGRVQSVATKIIVERENEIRSFVPQEYWTIDADLLTSKNRSVRARFYGTGDRKIELSTKAEADAILKAIEGKDFTVAEVKRGTKTRIPAPPFTTSSLLQEASRKLNFQSQRTMRVAQELYEGVNVGTEFGGTQGLITYMRTDSLRISADARDAAKAYILEKYGDKYYPDTARTFKTDANAQDAHEAIRPSKLALEPAAIKKYLSSDQYKLYKLIWDRFLASQMTSAEIATVVADFRAGDYIFRTGGYSVLFQGYMTVYEESGDETPADAEDVFDPEKNARLPAISEGESLSREKVGAEQHFTEPPMRYNEASLIKFFKDKGIGRPSTYTPIITIILSRGYVAREGKSLKPTPLGEITTKLMDENFPDIVDYQFTANMETRLDTIENGSLTMEDVLGTFYRDFKGELSKAEKRIGKQEIEVPVQETDIICELCGAKMIVKNGRYGKFAACPNYPTCKNTKPLGNDGEVAEKKVEIADFKCELCGSDMILRQGRYGSFYACARYPACKNTKPKTRATGIVCPKCGGEVVTKYARNRKMFYSCSKYPECDFSTWDIPSSQKCPECGAMLLRKKGKNYLYCYNDACGYRKETGADGEQED